MEVDLEETMKNLWMFYFIIHLGIGGMCGFTDIKMDSFKTVDKDDCWELHYKIGEKNKKLSVAYTMPYYIEEIQ
jgi:hypothetical protein